MKVIIAGGRNFQDYNLLRDTCDYMLHDQKEIEVVSGKAYGADELGEVYAKGREYKIKEFPADWTDFSEPCVIKVNKKGEKYNALAGLKRNERMAQYADALIAFWDGKSTGTKDMIERARKHGLKVKVQMYKS